MHAHPALALSRKDTIMSKPEDMQALVPSGRPRTRRRWAIAATVAAVAGVLTISGIGYAKGDMDMSFGHGMHHHLTQEQMSQHIDKMVNHVLADATPDQRSKVDAIAQAALKDLYPLRQQHEAAHQQLVQLLTQTTIDRAALEQVRFNEMQLADQVSRRITQAVADAADVLPPEQRAKLAEHMRQRMHQS
jgi:Spy/CpxP family protein refolding chaperone